MGLISYFLKVFLMRKSTFTEFMILKKLSIPNFKLFWTYSKDSKTYISWSLQYS